MLKYTYGICVIESTSMITQEAYAVRFYHAESLDLVGVHKSHGCTYLEAREIYKRDCGQVMGLDKLVIEDV